MPAERTKAMKRSDSTSNQFVWSTQPEPTQDSDFDSINYDGPPPLVDAPATEFILFPPPEDVPAPRRQPHSKKKPENHIPRPPNAFILFRSSFIKSQHVSTEVETNHSTLSKIIGLTWQRLSEDERKVWHTKAKEALEEHKRKFPKYAFRPVQTKTKGAPSEKRKVREVEPKDIKRCAKIAQLLVEGKKGQALDQAIQEFDKHHVPEIVTRFEAPITARAFRRSSSAPVPDTELGKAEHVFLQMPVPSANKKPRGSSAKPTRCPTPQQASQPVAIVEPVKQETPFEFTDFTFQEIAQSPMSPFECDPLAMPPADCFDSSFPHSPLDTTMMSDWASSPSSPMSPATPDYMMSPTLGAAPAPVYGMSPAFEPFDQLLDKSFADFQSHHYPVFNQGCNMAQTLDMCGGGVGVQPMIADSNTLYPGYSDPTQLPLDMDFSSFIMPSYAM
ncbi:hypothetical protein CVT24_001300 [Panaeolus cyanescens]|uniref:HMG box domain-containing protein n=1 Tax=Panaeolus cyanescens TaxID=181874 RepID=A0A409YG09_9AGAR|nr:hypothetical protein CVT24_001300 [Panaeolus cyanescens]